MTKGKLKMTEFDKDICTGDVSDLTISKFTGYSRRRPTMGEMQDTLKALYDLPQIGDVVLLREVGWYGYVNANATYLRSISDYRTIDGKDMYYRAASFTVGRNEPLHPHNKMILDCVYPPNCQHNKGKSIPTRWIATGSTVALKCRQENDGYEVIDEVQD